MSCIVWKSFNLCFSKFKCFPTISYPPPPVELDRDHLDFSPNDPSILKNFNSLYDPNSDHDSSTPKSLPFSFSSTAPAATTTGDIFSSSSSGEEDSMLDFTSAFATNRFFVSSPGSSNSIFGPTKPSEPGPVENSVSVVVRGGVAVETYSPDPYGDFKKSMVEMIEARRDDDDDDSTADYWEFMNELLLCYLALNPKHMHKFIVGAFSDVVVSLVLPPEECRKSRLPMT